MATACGTTSLPALLRVSIEEQSTKTKVALCSVQEQVNSASVPGWDREQLSGLQKQDPPIARLIHFRS